MYKRLLQWPKNTSFLFGPRGTGKSTWIEQSGHDCHVVDLLETTLALAYERRPGLFREQILAQATRDQWIVVDEIQKVPRLLDEIHFLIEKEKYKNFLLTGSSARKLRATAANLLGGRARIVKFFPLLAAEVDYKFSPETHLNFGSLPLSLTESSVEEKELFLQGYIETYIVDEIKRETQIRNVAGFQRFLEVAAICSGQPVNQANIARDAQVARDSVRTYFEVLEDTLIGFWLPAYRRRIKVKEVATPKFYWFDSGVLNAAAGYTKQPSPSDWRGILLETWLVCEVRAYMELFRVKGSLAYWRTTSGSEVDLIWWYGEKVVLIEIKSAKKIRKEHLKGIKSFRETSPTAVRAILVNLGSEKLIVDDVEVLPALTFLKKLHAGELIGT
jgi:uncharacterized protein